MADEKKTYLVEVKSNIDKYAKEAAEARKKVDELTVANIKMQGSDKASAAEKEASNAALRTAQKEYRNAKKMVDLQTAANKSETGSRKQLGEVLKLQEQELGKLGKAYVLNAKGVRELNPLYIEQRKRIKETKDSIIEYDKSLGDGRSSVGLYSEALGGVGDNLLSMGKNLVGAGAIIGAVTAVFNKLKEAVMSTTVAIDAMNQVQAVSKQLFYDLAVHGQINIDNLKNASAAQTKLNEIRIEELQINYRNSKQQQEINALMLASTDITKSDEERLEKLNKIRVIDTEQTKIKVDLLKKELLAIHDLRKGQEDNEELLREEYRIMTDIRNEQAKSDAAMRRVESQQSGIRKRQIADYMKRNELLKEGTAEYAKMQDEIAKLIIAEAELAAQKKFTQEEIEEQVKYKPPEEKMPTEIEEALFIEAEKERIWQEGRVAAQKAFAENKKLAQTQADELINIELAKLDQKQEIADAEIAIAAGLGDLLGQVAGKSKTLSISAIVAEKAAAIAQVISNITIANAKALAMSPLTLGQPWVTLNTAFGAVSIANMIAQAVKSISEIRKQGGTGGDGGGSATVPTAIASAPPAQRSYATPTGSTIFTQPQMSQQQLNALPQQNMLSADEIAQALSRMPAPKVSVEDINARMDEVKKVKVRADI